MTGPWELLLALALLTTPDVTTLEDTLLNGPLLQAAAVHLELLDSSAECAYYFHTTSDYRSDTWAIRWRYERARQAPASSYAAGLPPAAFCERMQELGSIYYARCQLAAELFPAEAIAWTLVALEVQRRCSIWYLVRDVQTSATVYSRRLALAQLRDVLGEEDFCAGRLPWPIPWQLP